MLSLDRDQVARVLVSLVERELARLRPGQPLPPHSDWCELVDLNNPAIAVDSLERLHLASAVSEVFHVYETAFDDLFLRYGELCRWVDIVLKSRSEYNQRFSFRSGGSTGTPKLCMHETAALAHEAREWSEMLSDRTRILSYVPPHHIYGFLFTVLLPSLLDVEVIDMRSGGGPAWERGDLVISFPDHLATLVQQGRTFAPGVFVVSSTAPLRATLHNQLRAQGLEGLIEIYGSSESGGMAYRYQPHDPYQLLPHLSSDPTGDLIAHVPGRKPRAIEPPDHLRWVDSRQFYVNGRKDNSVQVGGINVYPLQIASRIAQHPYIKEAVVRKGNVGGVERLKALLVFADPRLDSLSARQEVLHWLRDNLQTEEMPGSITFANTVPTNAFGKVTDWPVPEEELLIAQ